MKKHRWVVVATYELTDELASATNAGGPPVLLGDQNIMSIDGPGCLDCEKAYREAGRFCLAPAWVVIPLKERANVRFGPPPEAAAVPPVLKFTVYGIPKPKGSKTAFPIRRKGGGLGVAVREGKPGSPFEEYRRRVESVVQDLAGRGNGLITGPLRVRMHFVFAKPKSAPRSREWPDVKPDLVKLMRGIEDALTGALIKDDAQIVQFDDVRKEYGETPRAEVSVWLA